MTQRILVVDDDGIIRQLVNRVLTGAGYAVDTAGDGIEALEKLKRKAFDLLLTDVWMPRMNGLELLAHLRNEPVRPKVVVMTADDTPETLLQAVREQAYQYVTKPVEVEALVKLIYEVLAAPAPTAPIEVLSARPEWVELLVPCELPMADRIQSFLLQLKADLSDEVRDSVGRAFRELLLNAIEWGGQLDPHRKVRISYLRARRMLMYRIADPGPGFSLEGLPHAAVSNPEDQPFGHIRVRKEKGLRPGGFGILMVSQMVDELIYNEKRNEVVFVKYLD